MKSTVAAKKAEHRVARFYNTVGWQTDGNVTGDARRFEDLRKYSQSYARKTRNRLLKFIPSAGDRMLDMASGPIQYPEYLAYSKNFAKRYCVDLSHHALRQAREKIGDHGKYFEGNFLRLDFEDNYFDCSISLHTIYHIEKHEQDDAVRKLIRITKPGKPILIVYSNPDTIWNRGWLKNWRLKRHKKKVKKVRDDRSDLYFYRYPNSWWQRFNNVASVRILPWRSFGPEAQARLFPNNRFGAFMLQLLFFTENTFPRFFAKNFEYNMIVLIKK